MPAARSSSRESFPSRRRALPGRRPVRAAAGNTCPRAAPPASARCASRSSAGSRSIRAGSARKPRVMCVEASRPSGPSSPRCSRAHASAQLVSSARRFCSSVNWVRWRSRTAAISVSCARQASSRSRCRLGDVFQQGVELRARANGRRGGHGGGGPGRSRGDANGSASTWFK